MPEPHRGIERALRAELRTILGRAADARQHVRNASVRPLLVMMKPWLETELGRIPPAGPLADAIRYTLARWPALCRFLDDGRIELDNNPVERAIRPIALGRKNHLFAGSDGGARWATVCSLIATAKLNTAAQIEARPRWLFLDFLCFSVHTSALVGGAARRTKNWRCRDVK